MNYTHLHLLLNHFPVIGTLIGCGLLLWGIFKNQNNIKASAAVIFIVMAIIALPVYFTGEPAEESVEKLPGVLESAIEMHEEAATVAIWLMGISGIAAIIALVFHRQKKHSVNSAYMALFVLSLSCFVAMARTGYYGGQIRHTEIAGANQVLQNNNENNQGEGVNKDKKDDD
jgi:hypothetical protein